MQNSKRSYLCRMVSLLCPRTREQREKMKMVLYILVIGSIMYTMLSTRLDISYAFSMTSRYQKDLGEDHWTAVKNILKYLRMTKDLILIYSGEEHLIVTGYCDTSFQTDRDDLKSQTEYIYMFNGGAIYWMSFKQDSTADKKMLWKLT
jgi:hypothetical protein